jgi:hypothetical protein
MSLDRLEGRIEVEPLGERAWSQIERRVFDELDAAPARRSVPALRRNRWLVPLVAATAFAAGLGAVLIGRSMAPLRAQPAWVVSDAGPTAVTLSAARLELLARSAAFVHDGGDEGITVILDRGGVDCEVEPRHGRPPFVVQAGDVRVSVLGTRFVVLRQGDDVLVQVVRGLVRVESRDGVRLLRPAESWRSIAPRGPTPIPLPMPVLTPPPTTAAPVPLPTPPAPIEVEQPLPRRTTRGAPRAAEAPVEPPPPAPVAPSATEAADPGPSSAELFDRAARLEARDPAGAARGYEELERRDGAWAANALFARARLEADRGHAAAARALLGRYLERFPRGSNAEDARALLRRLR